MKNMYALLLGILSLCCIATSSKAQTDTIPPEVLDFQIEFTDDALTDSADAVFTITYSEDIELIDTFTIVTHYFSDGAWEEYDRYDDAEVVIEGNVLTVRSDRSFWSQGRYEFVIAAGSVHDSVGNYGGSFTRTFMGDENAPEVIEHSIELTDNELNDSINAVFILTYSEDVQLADTFQIVTHVLTNGAWEEYARFDESEVVVNGNTVTITPSGAYNIFNRYELVVTFGSVTDYSGNMATSFTRVFTVDITPPEVINIETEYIETDFSDSLKVSFILTYNENVKLAPTYNFITYYNNAGVWEEYELLTDTSIVISGSTITLNPEQFYSSSDTYELVVTAGSVKDLVDNQAGSFTQVFLLDTIRPQLIDISPDLSLPVANDAIFTFIFDENVRLANDFGFYTYQWNADSAKYIEYEQLNASHAIVENNVVTFDPSLDFIVGDRVQIVLTSGSVLDSEGNRFQYVRENDTLNYVSERFWTVDSGFTVVTFLPRNDESLSEIPGELTISFSEKITLTDTTAVDSLSLDSLVYLRSNGTDLEHVAVFDTVANIITIVPAEELAWGSSYTFGFIEGFLNDAYDSIPAGEATFTILEQTAGVDTFTIAEINGQGAVSPQPGQVVQISGTITGIYPNEGFFVQDSVKLFSGIWVEYADLNEYAIGDGVIITGMVDTLQGVTAFVAEEVTTADSAVTIEPLVFDFANDSIQMYQALLVQVLNARASEADSIGNWALFADSDADSMVVNNRMFEFTPTDSSFYNVTGIITGWDSIYQIEPRMETDIEEVSEEFVAIAEIHGDTVTSPYLGQEVLILGTVTAVYPDEGFFVQDENASRSGIWVEYADTLQLVAGDGVTVSGTVEEMNGTTSLVAEEVNLVDAPLTVEPIVFVFGTDSIPLYQGVLVQVTDARASDVNMDGDWTLFAGNDVDSVIIGSWLYAYTPVADNSYDVTGVVTFRDSIYRIEPRMEADIVDVTDPTSADLIPEIDYNVYPNPFGNFIKISNNDKLSRVIISNITGQRVVDSTYPDAEINTSHLVSGVYIINMFNEDELVKTSRIIKQ